MSRRATGPKTAAGKAVSSQNARRHGLNAPPDEDLVTAWLNVILNSGGDTMEEANADYPRREAALRLAIAEAHYHRALHKADTHELEPHSAQQRGMKLRDEIWTVFDRMPQKITDGPEGLVRLQSRRKPKFPKRTQITNKRRVRLAPAKAPV